MSASQIQWSWGTRVRVRVKVRVKVGPIHCVMLQSKRRESSLHKAITLYNSEGNYDATLMLHKRDRERNR